MSLLKIVENLNPFASARKSVARGAIYSQEEFRSILERERARSDRSGQRFSVVAFEVGNPETNGVCTERLAQVLSKRLRLTDAVGWFDQQHIGVFLYNTPSEGAWRFANDIRQVVADAGPPFECTVYVYPKDSPRLGRPGANPEKSWHSHFSSQRHIARSQPLVVFAGQRVSGSAALALQPPAILTQNWPLPALELRPLFIHGIPAWKRAMDIAGAIVGLVLFSPIMFAVAIAIKLTSKGPVIFKQQRAGLGGKPFTFYKFRSMVVDAEDKKKELMKFNERTGPVFKMTNDPRLTSVGKFIRKWSLDELPQFYNVLRGDMSLVGPRPLPVEESSNCQNWQDKRLEAKPGITCLWQISARDEPGFDDWVRLDIEYAQRQSLLLDLRILLKTFPAVLSRRGAR